MLEAKLKVKVKGNSMTFSVIATDGEVGESRFTLPFNIEEVNKREGRNLVANMAAWIAELKKDELDLLLAKIADNEDD